MNKNVKLVMVRLGSKVEFMHDTVKSAARAAVTNVEMNEAAPEQIQVGGDIVWKINWRVKDGYDKLRELAELPQENDD
jgi:hypothetical protein